MISNAYWKRFAEVAGARMAAIARAMGKAGEEDGRRAVALPFQGGEDLPRADEGMSGFLPAPGLQQPGGAQEHPALLDGPPGLPGEGVRISHAHADQIDFHGRCASQFL